MSFERQRDDYAASLAWVAGLMASTSPSSLDAPTPCADYDVRALMGHLIGTAERGLGTAERRSTRHVPHVVTDIRDEELAGTYAALARRIEAAWGHLAADEVVPAPWGGCPALEAARGFTVETITHGWDLAVATGRACEPPPGIADRCLEFARSVVPDRLRGVMYGPPVAGDPDSSAIEQLAALLGHERPRSRPAEAVRPAPGAPVTSATVAR